MSVAEFYPIMLDVRGRDAVVVGGGAIAEQKVAALLEAGARVTVVSPAVTARLHEWYVAHRLAIMFRGYRPGDLKGRFLAIAATDDRALHASIREEADAERVLLNAVDDTPRCHFIAPSVLRRGPITVAISSAGRSPALAVRLRERIAGMVRDEHGRLADVLGGLRDEAAALVPDQATRTRAWYRVVDALIDEAAVGADALRRRAGALLRREGRDAPAALGSVALVGAGPGDPALITVRGRELLRRADVVLHDRLVSAELLREANASATLEHVGKHGHGESASQDAINARLVEFARAGKRVVRLKGGDPFVFGRGGEECAALREAGIPFEVVPGITSAIAAAAAIGVPVTHREVASSFTVATGHDADGDEERHDWAALAAAPTLVLLMGRRAVGAIVARLLAAGRDGDTPAAMVSRATLPEQRAVVATLATIAARAEDEGLAAPATLVVGEVVRAAERGAGVHIPCTGNPRRRMSRVSQGGSIA